MPNQLHFLDWRQPALRQAADYLRQRYQTGDELNLERVLIAVPGGRAGRRLLEILVEQAEEGHFLLVPPQIITAGELPERLYQPKLRFANTMTQRLAWVAALRELTPQALEPLVPHPPKKDDLDAWLALGEMLRRLHTELAANLLDFGQVHELARQLDSFDETPRWRVLRQVQAGYLRQLDEQQLWDLQTARQFAIHHHEPTADFDIILVGMVDLDRAHREMLLQVRDRVTAVVFGDPREADGFDSLGCLRAEAWQTREIPLAAEQVLSADTPADQAEAMISLLADWNGRYSAEEVAIGVPDPRLVPFLVQQLRQQGLPTRQGAGRAMTQTEPYHLLEALGRWVALREADDLAELVRLPSMQKWLISKGVTADLLTALDQYLIERLPQNLLGRLIGQAPVVSQILRHLQELVQRWESNRQTLGAWGEIFLQTLVRVYEIQPLDRDAEPGRTIIRFCDYLQAVVADLEEVPSSLAQGLAASNDARFTCDDALPLLLQETGRGTIPDPQQDSAIELLGWLELPLDDAPALILTGLNEGIVPASYGADPFLPGPLRTRLAIEDNEQRFARDVYALSALLASRRELRIICGRRGADNEPLLPSRLLLAAQEAELPQRVNHLLKESSLARRGGRRWSRAAQPVSFAPTEPAKLPELRPAFRVTEFRDYLACPFRYYLRHQLGLAALDDQSYELQRQQFGSLLHQVLQAFGQSEARDLTSEAHVKAFLLDTLSDCARREFGPHARPAVKIQVAQAELRLVAFAKVQVEWRRQGYRIAHTEVSFDATSPPLNLEGKTFQVRGRIDRIDLSEDGQTAVVFDYKSSDEPHTPEANHFAAGEWIDLQLPLYRHLARQIVKCPTILLGYVMLPRRPERTKICLAEWSEGELRQADVCAAQVVSQIRDQRFWPLSDDALAQFGEFSAICLDELRQGRIALNQLEEGADG